LLFLRPVPHKELDVINDNPSDLRPVSRREVLALGAGLGAAAALGIAPARAQAAKPVLTRKIPRSGESLPVIGLGTAIVFDIGNDAAKRAERTAVIRIFLEGGARLIDTAPSYGTAEAVVGDLLADMKVRDRVFVATKARVAGRDRSVTEMQQSQRRLRTDKIELIQIHNVGFASRGEVASQLALLREWKARGVYRYVGVTHSQDQESANDRLMRSCAPKSSISCRSTTRWPSAAWSSACSRPPRKPVPRSWSTCRSPAPGCSAP
jgi:hypothetical protein